MTKKFPNDKVTCISPWYELRIDADGKLRCCHSIRQAYSEETNLSFLDWFNHANQTRINIVNGDESPGCSACYYNENNNLISHRMQRNLQAAIYHGEYFTDSLLQSPAYKRMNGEYKIYPAFMHVTLSNLCNLKCRMCFPKYSSQLTETYKKINWMSKDEPTLIDWTVDDNKWSDFLDLVKINDSLMSLHFMGGEPLYHKRFYEFIDWSIENNKTDYHLTFVTNGTVFKQELIDKLKRFKSVQIEISIENLSVSNNYIRTGSDFNQVKDNILKFINTDMKVVLRTVPQALSIRDYDTILDFALEHNLGFDSNVLDKPEHLKCFILPKHIKNEISDKIRSKYMYILSNNINNNNTALFRAFDGIKTHIESLLQILNEKEPEDIEILRRKFIQHNAELDTISEIKFAEIYPELFEFYEKYSTI